MVTRTSGVLIARSQTSSPPLGRFLCNRLPGNAWAPLSANAGIRLSAMGFRTLTVVDNCTRECLALIADTSLSGARVARELATIIERRGKPAMIISDNGTEFTSNAILAFADKRKVD